MSGLLTIDGKGTATGCAIASVAAHRPTPLRFVWHHVQPQTAGGLTQADNLIELCDSCHYSTHRILFAMRNKYLNIPLTTAQQGYLASPPRQSQLTYAQQGFDECVAAGTVDKIPNEG